MPQKTSRLTSRLESLRPDQLGEESARPRGKSGQADKPQVPAGTAKSQAASPSGDNPKSAREVRSAARRKAILMAALEEFSASGFAAARLEDVARRAGVAKGTIYLYFADKETLFQELARSMLSPVVGNIESFAAADLPFPMLLDRMVEIITTELIGTRRQDILRLIIAEGPRFPALADFYYREVLSRILAAVRLLLERAYERGELKHKALVTHPQLLFAPALMTIVWNGLFERHAPLDARAMIADYLHMLFERGRP